MRFENYTLRYSQGVEINGCGHDWDLHNFAELTGFSHDPQLGTCEFVWSASSVTNPWGDPENAATGCRLEFTGVSVLEHEPGTGSPDVRTLSEISDIPQDSADNHESDTFDLWLTFEDGSAYKLRAAATRLVPIP